LFLAGGIGLFLAQTCGILLSLYAIDRLFEPPFEVRLILLFSSLFLELNLLWKGILSPLRQRPSPRDFAALWERSHPQLAGLLSTSVEISAPHTGISPDLLQKVHEQTELALQEDLEPNAALPSRFSLARLARGLSALLVLIVLAVWQPGESKIFLNHLFGGKQIWPRATQLVLLPPRLEGGGTPPAWEQVGPEEFRLSVAASSSITLRIRAEGKVPEAVWALGNNRKRKMRSVGGEEFVLRLPPLLEAVNLRFEGGDDTDGTPFVQLLPGRAPGFQSWLVHISPPDYMGLDPWTSNQHELRIPQGSDMELEFQLNSPADEVSWHSLDGSRDILIADTSGTFHKKLNASSSGEGHLSIRGLDGFINPRAALLRWKMQADHPPELEVFFPVTSWATLPGASVPMLISAKDDFGLSEASLFAPGLPLSGFSLELTPKAKQETWFQKLQVPEQSDTTQNPEEGMRFRARVLARDLAPPAGQNKETESPWIEVMAPEELEEHHAQGMVRVRERVEKLIEIVAPIARGDSPEPRAPRSLRQNSRRIQEQLTLILSERIYANVDSGNLLAQTDLDLLLRSGSEPGFPGGADSIVQALASAPLIERSAWVRDLALAILQSRRGSMNELLRTLDSGKDSQQSATLLEMELRSMLEALLEWEDFKSAIDLLRGLLERQRAIHLQTIESANR